MTPNVKTGNPGNQVGSIALEKVPESAAPIVYNDCYLFLFGFSFDNFGQALGDFWESDAPGRGAGVLSAEVRQSDDKASVFFGEGGNLLFPEIAGVGKAVDEEKLIFWSSALCFDDLQSKLGCFFWLGLWTTAEHSPHNPKGQRAEPCKGGQRHHKPAAYNMQFDCFAKVFFYH